MERPYFNDLPIDSSAQDAFGHHTFAKKLCGAILDSRNSGANVLAVTGEWGVGKSGILQMLEAELDAVATPNPEHNSYRPTTIRFSPWIVGSRSGLIASFFGQLNTVAEEIRSANLGPLDIDRTRWVKATKNLKKSLLKFSETASAAAAVAAPADPTGMTAVTAAGGITVSKILRSIRGGKSSLEQDRSSVISSLKDIASMRPGFRTVVLIDDLDRLEPHEAVEVLRLVKAVADFPFITYVLAYDERVLSRAIEVGMSVQNGKAYLAKIVQYSLSVPDVGERTLASWLQRLLQEEFSGAADFTSRRSSLVLSFWAGRLLETPRDVKRLIISLRMMWPSLIGKADFLDLVWIETLRLKANSEHADLYMWVMQYIEKVAERHDGVQAVELDPGANELLEILIKLGWKHGENAGLDYHYLDELLPGIDPAYLYNSHEVSVFDFQKGRPVDEFIAAKRLGSPRHWRLYTAFEPPFSAVPDDAVLDLNAFASDDYTVFEEEATKLIEEASKASATAADQILIEQIEPSIEKMTLQQKQFWLIYLFRNPKFLLRRSRVGVSSDPWNDFFKNALERVGKRLLRAALNEDESSINLLFKHSPSPWIIARIIDNILREREAGVSDVNSETLSDEEWSKFSGSAHALFQRMTTDDFESSVDPWPIQRTTHAWAILFAWKRIGFDHDISSWVSAYLKESTTLCDRLMYFVSYSFSSQANPYLREKYLKEFVNTASLIDRLRKIVSLENDQSEKADFLLSIWRRPELEP